MDLFVCLSPFRINNTVNERTISEELDRVIVWFVVDSVCERNCGWLILDRVCIIKDLMSQNDFQNVSQN